MKKWKHHFTANLNFIFGRNHLKFALLGNLENLEPMSGLDKIENVSEWNRFQPPKLEKCQMPLFPKF